MTMFPDDLTEEAVALLDICRKQGLMIASAESCTGGLIAACLTEIAGSSDVFDCGFVTYSNGAKQAMLGVNAATLEKFGAVSRETAMEMALGALLNSRAGLSVAVTGIAGPGGGSAAKPVGLVHAAVCRSGAEPFHQEFLFNGRSREQVRMATLRAALAMLTRAVQ